VRCSAWLRTTTGRSGGRGVAGCCWPVTVDQFRHWLTQADPAITIRPVLDPATTAPVDAHEIPQRLRQAMAVRHPGSVWPFSPATSISTGGRLDLDHTIPHTSNGPPELTCMDNLGPLTRTEHRAKTLGGWQARQPDLGTYLWRSPDGLIALTTTCSVIATGPTRSGPPPNRVAPQHEDLIGPSEEAAQQPADWSAVSLGRADQAVPGPARDLESVGDLIR
jgi:hypothetical protein